MLNNLIDFTTPTSALSHQGTPEKLLSSGVAEAVTVILLSVVPRIALGPCFVGKKKNNIFVNCGDRSDDCPSKRGNIA